MGYRYVPKKSYGKYSRIYSHRRSVGYSPAKARRSAFNETAVFHKGSAKRS